MAGLEGQRAKGADNTKQESVKADLFVAMGAFTSLFDMVSLPPENLLLELRLFWYWFDLASCP